MGGRVEYNLFSLNQRQTDNKQNQEHAVRIAADDMRKEILSVCGYKMSSPKSVR